jgi:uncharacterized protein YjbI with pentapeptide repeats
MGIKRSDLVRKRLLAGEPVVLSASAGADKRTVPADWVTEALREGGTISLENARIAGRFNLHNVQIRGDLRLLSCEIQEFADFSYVVFERTLRLDRCNFKKGASFDSARLRSDVWFDESAFGAPPGPSLEKGTTFFNDAEFNGVLSANSVRFTDGAATSFQRARFGSLVVLTSARFEGAVDLSRIRVGGDLRLDRATFLSPCNLEGAIVTGSIALNETRFSRRAHVSLVDAEVARGIALSGAVLLGSLMAARARFGSIDGSQAVFARGIVLDDATVAGSVNLPRARFARRYVADLQRLSVGGQLDLSEALFKGPLRMNDAIVKKTLLAGQSRFLSWATFDRLEAGAVSLTGSRFESRVRKTAPTFVGVTVLGAFTANDARFQRGVVITKGRIGELSFDRARSYGTVNLGYTAVSGILSFSDTRIRAEKNLQGANVDKNEEIAVNLQGVSVGKNAWFEYARFAGKVFAIGLHVEQQLSWNNVVTLDDVDFYELDVKRGAFMQSAKFGGAVRLDRACLADLYLCAAVCRGAATFDKSSIATLNLGEGDAPHDRAAVLNGGISLLHSRMGYVNFCDVTVSDVQAGGRSRRTTPYAGKRRGAMFAHWEISGVANFTGAKFQIPANFYGATFVGEALFQRVEFSDPGSTSFSASRFNARAVFYRTRFKGEADFSYARFEGTAIFRARFGGRAMFDMCRFLGAAEFSDPSTVRWESSDSLWEDPDRDPPGSSFADVSFVQARFGGDARFDSVKFAGELDLREATFATLSLPSDSDSGAESELLPLRIGLVGCRYEHVVLRHPDNLLLRDGKALRLLEGYDRQPFAQLEDTLRRAGDDRAADKVYLAGRRAEGRQKPPLSRLLDLIYGELVNYGVRPWRLAGLAVLFVLFGAWFFNHPGAVQVKEKDQRTEMPYPITWQEALNVGVAHFLPVSLPIKEQLVPNSQIVDIVLPVPGSGSTFMIHLRPSTIATILQLAGWILVPIGVAAMTGVLMRKKK